MIILKAFEKIDLSWWIVFAPVPVDLFLLWVLFSYLSWKQVHSRDYNMALQDEVATRRWFTNRRIWIDFSRR